MSNFKNIFIECEKATHYCDKSQYKEASFWEKLKLSVHLLYCKTCRKYSSKNGKLTKAMQDCKSKKITKTEKEELEQILKQELSK